MSFGSVEAIAVLWAAVGLNYFVLSRFVRALHRWLQAVHDVRRNDSAVLQRRVVFWGAFKILCLILLGVFVWRYRSVPGMTLLLGIAPVVILPIVGGYLWSRKHYGTPRV